MEPLKTNQTTNVGATDTFPPSLHLVPFCQLCLVFVSCVQRVVEGSAVGSAGCVEHVGVHREWVMLWVAAIFFFYFL